MPEFLLKIVGNKWFVTFVAVSIIAIICFLYFDWSQKSIAALNQQIAQQDVKITIQDDTIKQLKDRMQVVEQASAAFDKAVTGIRIQTNELSKSFSQKTLLQQSLTKPSDTEVQINTLTNKLFKDLQDLTTGDKK